MCVLEHAFFAGLSFIGSINTDKIARKTEREREREREKEREREMNYLKNKQTYIRPVLPLD